MDAFNENYRPATPEEAEQILSTMPTGHHVELGPAGRAVFAKGSRSYVEALEATADEPSEQQLFEIANGSFLYDEEDLAHFAD